MNPPSAEAPPDSFDTPAIGGLLRLAWQAHRDRMYARLADAGFPDVTRAQFALFRWPGIDGRHPGEVAEFVGLSKQAINDVLGELERKGYLERAVDPEDGRARIVRLTASGRHLQRTTHRISRELEATWASQIGKPHLDALRSALEAMVAVGKHDERH